MAACEVAGRPVGPGNPVFIIAEAGVNHNGDFDLARALVLEAKRLGADCVKFQTFKAERVATAAAPKAAYQLKTTDGAESQIEMLRKLELSNEDHRRLIELCRAEGIVFLSTPYNFEDVDFLDELGVPAFKIASGQAVEHEFLRYLAAKGKPLFLSTGMCTLAEVDEAVRVIRGAGNEQVVVLQCTTNYPSRVEDCNLLAMGTMARAMQVPVGYSDHTESLTAAAVSVGLGACVVERHFTLDKTLPGPDHSSSSNPRELGEMIRMVREAEAAMGTGIKQPCEAEVRNAPGMRRSLTAKVDIPAGAPFSWDNLTFKRPGTGFTGPAAAQVPGRLAAHDIPADTVLEAAMIDWS